MVQMKEMGKHYTFIILDSVEETTLYKSNLSSTLPRRVFIHVLMVWHYATDITDLVKAFAHEKQVDRDILTDVICGRTNTQLKLLQDKFADISGDEKDQPTALIDFLTTKIENLVDRNKDDIVKFVSRVLEDPYLRTDPAERDDSQDQDDKKSRIRC